MIRWEGRSFFKIEDDLVIEDLFDNELVVVVVVVYVAYSSGVDGLVGVLLYVPYHGE
jgi:hypothetical protein